MLIVTRSRYRDWPNEVGPDLNGSTGHTHSLPPPLVGSKNSKILYGLHHLHLW